MPVLWGRHDWSQVFLSVVVLGAAEADRARAGWTPAKVQFCKALIDTGAMSTCLSKRIAEQIGLAPIGKVPVHSVSGLQHHNSYLFYVGFSVVPLRAESVASGPPETSPPEIQVLPIPIQGVELDSGHDFDVLLGMDVIATGSLKIEGDGTFSWAW